MKYIINIYENGVKVKTLESETDYPYDELNEYETEFWKNYPNAIFHFNISPIYNGLHKISDSRLTCKSIRNTLQVVTFGWTESLLTDYVDYLGNKLYDMDRLTDSNGRLFNLLYNGEYKGKDCENFRIREVLLNRDWRDITKNIQKYILENKLVLEKTPFVENNC